MHTRGVVIKETGITLFPQSPEDEHDKCVKTSPSLLDLHPPDVIPSMVELHRFWNRARAVHPRQHAPSNFFGKAAV